MPTNPWDPGRSYSWDLKVCILIEPQEMLMLLVYGPHLNSKRSLDLSCKEKYDHRRKILSYHKPENFVVGHDNMPQGIVWDVHWDIVFRRPCMIESLYGPCESSTLQAPSGMGVAVNKDGLAAQNLAGGVWKQHVFKHTGQVRYGVWNALQSTI